MTYILIQLCFLCSYMSYMVYSMRDARSCISTCFYLPPSIFVFFCALY